MINLSEHRLRNLVEYPTGSRKAMPITVDAFSNRRYAESNCSPIPLTADTILKCGFKLLPETETLFYIKFEDLELTINIVNGKWYIEDEFSQIHRRNHPIKYLHQLQNLYFALTGEELKINL
jgi:hypothetical protein